MQILIDISHGEERLAGLPLEELALFVLEREEAPASSEASLSFIDDARMAQLNEEFRGKTGPTERTMCPSSSETSSSRPTSRSVKAPRSGIPSRRR